MSDFELPALALACSHLRLDVGELIEAVLSGMDAGFTEREAVTMSIVEALQQRGAYHGAVKRMIDDGVIFQMAEDGGHDRRGARRMGRGSARKNSPSSPQGSIGLAVDDG